MNKLRSFAVLAIATALTAIGGRAASSDVMHSWWMVAGSGAVAALVAAPRIARWVLVFVAGATLAVAATAGNPVSAVAAVIAAAAFGTTAYAAGSWQRSTRYETAPPGNAWTAIDRGDDPTL